MYVTNLIITYAARVFSSSNKCRFMEERGIEAPIVTYKLYTLRTFATAVILS